MRPLFPLLVALACAPQAALSDDQPIDAFPLRNHNPFLQVYGVPTFATHELAASGGVDFDVSLDISNDMDEADRVGEVLVIDAEVRTLNLSVRRRVSDRLEIGLEVPYVSYSGGILDNVITDFHSLFGLSNSTRQVPSDLFRLYFEQQGVVLYDAASPKSGIGDLRLTAATSFGPATLRLGIKAPTGDPDKLTGSGAADMSLGLHGGGATALFDRRLAYSGFLGAVLLGEGDVMPALQRSVVPFGGLALRWHVTERLALGTQLYAQGPFLDAALDELGGYTLQLAAGFDYRFPDRRLLLRFAIAEDIAAAAAPDFAVQLSLRRYNP